MFSFLRSNKKWNCILFFHLYQNVIVKNNFCLTSESLQYYHWIHKEVKTFPWTKSKNTIDKIVSSRQTRLSIFCVRWLIVVSVISDNDIIILIVVCFSYRLLHICLWMTNDCHWQLTPSPIKNSSRTAVALGVVEVTAVVRKVDPTNDVSDLFW